MEIIIQIILQIIGFLLLFLIPGYFIFRLFDIKNKNISVLDKILIIVPLSLFANYFIFLLLNFIKISITQISVLISILILIIFSLIIKFPKIKFSKPNFKFLKDPKTWIFLTILFIGITLRILLTSNKLYPFTTDFSHHIYYAKLLIENATIPIYPHPQFVVGEHIFISFVPLISGFNIMSYIPVISLLILNILTTLTLYRITYHATKSYLASYLTFFLISVLFITSNPQLTYVFGGVIGNVLGFFLISICMLLAIAIYKYNIPQLAPIFLAALLVMAYSHTLSSVMLGTVFFIGFITYILFNFSDFKEKTKKIFTLKNIIVVLIFLSIFLLYIPNYFFAPVAQEQIRRRITLERIINPFLEIGQNRYILFFSVLLYALAFIGFLVLTQRKQDKKSIDKFLIPVWFFIPLLYTINKFIFPVIMPLHRTVNFIFHPMILLMGIGFSYIKKLKLKCLLITCLIIILLLTYPPLTDKFEFNTHEKEKLNQEAFIYIASQLEPGENIFTEHLKSGIADQAIKNFIPIENKVYFRTFWFRYVQDNRSMDSWNMMEDPNKNINLYKEYNISYVLLGNEKERYTDFIDSNNFNLIFENQEIIILKVNYNSTLIR